MLRRDSECAMEATGDLAGFIWNTTYIRDGGFQYKMKYSLVNTKKEKHSYDPFAVNAAIAAKLLQFTITSLPSLFAVLMAVDGTS